MRRGLTLAELLITTGLISLISLLLIVIWISARRLVERTESQQDLQQRLCEPSLRLAHWLRGALYGNDSPVRIPSRGQTAPILEFYSCDRLVGNLPPIAPRQPTLYIYRVFVSGPDQDCWLGRQDTTGLTLEKRRIGKFITLEFTNLDGYQIKIKTSSQGSVRRPGGIWKTLSSSLTTVIAAPYEN